MKKLGKRILRIGGIVLAAVFLVIIILSAYVYFHKPALKDFIEKNLSKTPGLTVTIGRLNYRLFPFCVEAHSVKIVFISVLGRADVLIAKAEAVGSFQRVLRNRKPYLDSLAVRGLKLEFYEDPSSPPTGPLNIPVVTRLVSDYLEYASEVSVRDSSLHLSLPVEGMDLAAAGVDLKASGGDRTAVRMRAKRFDFRNDRPGASLSARIGLDATWPRSGPFRIGGNIDLAAAAASFPEKSWQGSGLGLKAGFVGDTQSVTVPGFTFEIPDLAAVSGSGQAGLGKAVSISVASKLEVKNIDLLKKAFASFLPPGLPDFTLDGRILWDGDVQAETAAGAAKISIKGTLRLPAAHFAMKQGDFSTDQMVQAELQLEGEPANLSASGVIEGSRADVVAGSFEARGLSYRLPVSVEGGRLTLSSLSARARELVLRTADRDLKFEGLSVTGRAGFNYANQSAEVHSLVLDIPRFGAMSFSGNVGAGPKPRVALSVRGQNLDIAGIVKSFPAFVPEALSAWQPAGQAALALEIGNGGPDPGRFRIKGTLNLAKGAFQDSTGTIVSEGLEPRLRFEVDFPAPESPRSAALLDPIPFSLELDLAKGESLWKDAYFNWQGEPARLELKGEYDPNASGIRMIGAKLIYGPVGEIRALGSVTLGPHPRFDLRLAVPAIDLARTYAFLGKMRASQPSTLEVRGGAEAEADIHFQNSWSARGRLRIRDAAARQKDGSLALTGIDVDFPFSISNGIRPGDEKDDYAVSPGHVQIGEFKTAAAALNSLRLDFLAARNLFLLFPVEIALWGARLDLGQSILSIRPASLAPRGVSRLALTDLDFSRLPFNTASFSIAGRASIAGNSLEMTPQELLFKGRVLAELFGGRMTLDSFRLTDPLSPGRRIMFQAEIEGLDLGLLTRAVPFGDVTGIVDVELRDFVLSYGQPESFALTIRSVPKKGVSQKFSLKAVDNLTVISSGGPSATPSNSFFMKLVHSFNYSRMGIACSLRNDVFHLQGTIVEGGIQYLVRRAAFFGIDVVNAKPVNTISFKDMLGRLERVGQSQEKK
jgi:hypothetical protein